MKNKDRIGQIALHQGDENLEPCIVYVLGKNGFDMLALQKINTGTLTMVSPDKDSLIDFDFEKYELLRAEWFIKHHEKAMQRWIKTREKIRQDIKETPYCCG